MPISTHTFPRRPFFYKRLPMFVFFEEKTIFDLLDYTVAYIMITVAGLLLALFAIISIFIAILAGI